MQLLLFLGLGYLGVVGALYFGQTAILFPGAGMPSQRLEQPRRP